MARLMRVNGIQGIPVKRRVELILGHNYLATGPIRLAVVRVIGEEEDEQADSYRLGDFSGRLLSVDDLLCDWDRLAAVAFTRS